MVASAAVLCAMAIAGTGDFALMIAPLALLVSSLLGGHYPGEGTIAWMATKVCRQGARSRGAPFAGRPASPRLGCTHGGLLIARSLCGRAPPPLAG